MKANTKLWLTEDGKPLIGKGKAQLLRAIDEEKSLNKACKKFGISYKHAWKMLKKIEERSDNKVVESIKGGKNQGTFLTDFAKELLQEYDNQINIIHETVEDETFWESVGLKISARNQISGKVVSVENGDVISKLSVSIEPSTIKSLITREAVEKLDIKEGDEVYAIVKSTEVMIAKK